jgi:sulfate/thiosulfate transport system permease protein
LASPPPSNGAASVAVPALGPRRSSPRASRLGARGLGGLGRGLLGIYLTALVLLPVAALIARSDHGGLSAFWREVTNPEAVAAIKLTLITSVIVVTINAFFGTIVAWVLVRDEFPGRKLVDAVIDLPFALPTIVAGLVLLSLYGKGSPVGVDIAFTRMAVGLALLFVTLPFVVRSVQPVLKEMDLAMEEAAASLGARPATIMRRVVLPTLAPAIISGVALSFARAVGEFGSLVLITGNLPFKTEAGSVYIFGQIQDENLAAAAAVSVVLLFSAVFVLSVLNLLLRRRSRHVA